MAGGFQEKVQTMPKHHVPPRTGATNFGVGRVAEATLVRAVVP